MSEKPLTIYLAGPLFTQAEQQWLKALQQSLQRFGERAGRQLEVVWPYELFTQQELAAWGSRAKHEIFSLCRKHLDRADMVIALLDGPQVDDGTAWELGYFFARFPERRPIIGIRTDFRNAGDAPQALVNLMLDCSCTMIVRSAEELMTALKRYLHTG
jgi:nucleoside 2-deoxyribosyltransferase